MVVQRNTLQGRAELRKHSARTTPFMHAHALNKAGRGNNNRTGNSARVTRSRHHSIEPHVAPAHVFDGQRNLVEHKTEPDKRHALRNNVQLTDKRSHTKEKRKKTTQHSSHQNCAVRSPPFTGGKRACVRGAVKKLPNTTTKTTQLRSG